MPSLMRCINTTARCGTLFRNDRLAHLDLTGHQHTYILTLCRHPGISQEQLAKRVFINKSNVARQLEKLEQAGFITRTPSEADKRVLLVHPTEKAHAASPAIHDVLAEWNRYITEGFTEEERTLFTTFLMRVQERAKAYAGNASADEGYL